MLFKTKQNSKLNVKIIFIFIICHSNSKLCGEAINKKAKTLEILFAEKF